MQQRQFLQKKYFSKSTPDGKGGTKKISTLKEFVKYRKGDVSLIVPKHNRTQKKANNES